MISQAFLNRYRKEVDQASKEAGEYVRIALQTYRQQNPQATVAETRNYVINLVNDSLSIFGGQSALIANDFFDELAREAGEEATAYMFDTINYDAVRESVHYQAGKLVEGGADEFMDGITSLSEYHVKREAFENLRLNCNKRGLAYARVPSGRDTCAFCFVLASRGFVYHSKESAGGVKGHEYHEHCDCVIVPGFGGGLDEDSQIEGYHPSKMRERYQQCVDTIEDLLTDERYKMSGSDKSFKEWQFKEIQKEVATRDFKWLYSGQVPSVTFESQKLEKETHNHRPHELKTANRLSLNGIKAHFVNDKEIDKTSKRHITIGKADFENGYEIKTPMSSKNAFGMVKNALENTQNKKGVKRLIIDLGEAIYLDEKSVIGQIQKQVSEYPNIKWVSILDQKGRLVDVVKTN